MLPLEMFAQQEYKIKAVAPCRMDTPSRAAHMLHSYIVGKVGKRHMSIESNL